MYPLSSWPGQAQLRPMSEPAWSGGITDLHNEEASGLALAI